MCREPRNAEINEEEFRHRRSYGEIVFGRERPFQFSAELANRIRAPEFVARDRGFTLGGSEVDVSISQKTRRDVGRDRREPAWLSSGTFQIGIRSGDSDTPSDRVPKLGPTNPGANKPHRTLDQFNRFISDLESSILNRSLMNLDRDPDREQTA